MNRILSVIGALLALSATAGYLAYAGFTIPHTTTGSVNTAVAATEYLYICQPSGAVTNPICPIDTAGADENIYASSEDMVPGSVRWQKIRVRNVGTDPWDLFSISESWQESSDPGGMCDVVPEAVSWFTDSPNVRPSLVAFGTTSTNTSTSLRDPSKNFLALGVEVGDVVYISGGTGQGQLRTITAVSATELTVTPAWPANSIPNSSSSYEVRDQTGPGLTILGKVQVPGRPEPVEGATYGFPDSGDDHSPVNGSAGFPHLVANNPLLPYSVHVEPGEYEDVLGIRLPVGTPDDCLNVVWDLNTVWDVQVHAP
jgi:hypothetical protein